MNQEQFKAAANISAGLATRWFPHIEHALNEFGITSPADISMFIAQAGHESAGFTRLTESLNYSPAGLMATFGRRITRYQAEMLGRVPGRAANQKAIANLVYGSRLGNTGGDDGWNYRGRGLIQITGKDNYRDCGRALKLDLPASPELLETDENAARSAAWFYTQSGCMLYSGNLAKVTRIINGGVNGIKERRENFGRALAVLTC